MNGFDIKEIIQGQIDKKAKVGRLNGVQIKGRTNVRAGRPERIRGGRCSRVISLEGAKKEAL